VNLKELGEAIAKVGLPLLGAALPIPGGAAIGAALASHVGASSSKPEDILATLGASAEAVQKAKEFEATHQEHMLELTSKYEAGMAQAEADDRKSARQAATDTKAQTPAFLSWIVILGTFAMYGYLLGYGNPKTLDDVILGRILGTLDTSFGIVLAFWLGTSFSSRQKDATISKLSA
jgi:hypothetical protein